jgi:hypothetical protein
MALIPAIVKNGGRVLAGTAPHSFVMPGLALHQEMQLFVDAGLTPAQALQSASLWVAEFLRVQKDLGSVEVGKLADIIVLSKNPLENIRNSRTVETVIQGGRVQPIGYHYSYANPISRFGGGQPGIQFGQPRLERITPATGIENSAAGIELGGQAFSPDATVFFDGKLIPSRWVSSTTLNATLPESLSRVGTHMIHVRNPRPGGGDSAPLRFIIKYGSGSSSEQVTRSAGATADQH